MTSTGTEIIFEARESENGGYWARALSESIFTQAETWEELKRNIKEAISVHFDEDQPHPKVVRILFMRDEVEVL